MSSFDKNLAEHRGTPNDDNYVAHLNSAASEAQPLLQADPSSSANDLEGHSTSHQEELSSNPETMPSPVFFTLSTIFGASSVALGAFGAHGLKRRINDPSRISNWSTAAQYQLIHSVALLATSMALPAKSQRWPAGLFVAGMTMFSGSIYLLVLDPQRFKALGPVTPIGGLCLIGGWIGLGVVGRRFIR